MSPDKPRSSLFYYVPVLLVAAVVVGIVFVRNYEKGEQAGKNAPPPAEGTRTAAAQVNKQALAKDVSLAAKGKGLFAINCASCHGSKGYGDGDKAASLNPKPRNYHTDAFKYGNTIVAIHNTILKGSPGTSMPSFALLPLDETWAMAHYVLTLIPNAPPITDEMVAGLPSGNTAGQPAAATTPKDTAAGAAGPRIPVKLAMERLTQAAPAAHGASKVNASLPGAALYTSRCASCHGERGEGKATALLNVSPYKYVGATSLAASSSPNVRDRNKFGDVVVKGLPGHMMPGQASLTSSQIDDLYAFIKSLQTP